MIYFIYYIILAISTCFGLLIWCHYEGEDPTGAMMNALVFGTIFWPVSWAVLISMTIGTTLNKAAKRIATQLKK